jgi:hypothetical protein
MWETDQLGEALKEAFEKVQALTPEPRYFMCNDFMFNRIMYQMQISHVNIRYYQIGPNAQFRVMPDRLGFIVSDGVPGETILGLSKEYAEEFLKGGEYDPETDKFSRKPITI